MGAWSWAVFSSLAHLSRKLPTWIISWLQIWLDQSASQQAEVQLWWKQGATSRKRCTTAGNEEAWVNRFEIDRQAVCTIRPDYFHHHLHFCIFHFHTPFLTHSCCLFLYVWTPHTLVTHTHSPHTLSLPPLTLSHHPLIPLSSIYFSLPLFLWAFLPFGELCSN